MPVLPAMEIVHRITRIPVQEQLLWELSMVMILAEFEHFQQLCTMGTAYSGYSGEDWGQDPIGHVSWKDAQGNVQEPTQDDHKWNPFAAKVILPYSDEPPKDGDEGTAAEHESSITEAHNSCVESVGCTSWA